MNRFFSTQLYPAVAILLVLTVLVGGVYPALVTIAAQVAFPGQANGSLVTTTDGRTIGSTLIGQAFTEPSSASNLAPTRQTLLDRVAEDIDRLVAANGGGTIPVDLVTASASGLDPHISPAAAEYQVARVAAARGISEGEVRAAVTRNTEQPLLGFLGHPAVNVLQLNLDLDGLLAPS